jgi:hypothetical protein
MLREGCLAPDSLDTLNSCFSGSSFIPKLPRHCRLRSYGVDGLIWFSRRIIPSETTCDEVRTLIGLTTVRRPECAVRRIAADKLTNRC